VSGTLFVGSSSFTTSTEDIQNEPNHDSKNQNILIAQNAWYISSQFALIRLKYKHTCHCRNILVSKCATKMQGNDCQSNSTAKNLLKNAITQPVIQEFGYRFIAHQHISHNDISNAS
jgi:hypothetical protein